MKSVVFVTQSVTRAIKLFTMSFISELGLGYQTWSATTLALNTKLDSSSSVCINNIGTELSPAIEKLGMEKVELNVKSNSRLSVIVQPLNESEQEVVATENTGMCGAGFFAHSEVRIVILQ
jgi:hypothetical protein